VPLPKPAALAGLRLGVEEGFVLSRVDGKLTVGQICLIVPFDAALTAAILAELARVGAIDIPGAEAPQILPPLRPEASARPVASAPGPPSTAAGQTALAGLDLTAEQARRIDEFCATLQSRDAFELLEVVRTADKREIKRAYFKLSKELHPDRFFGKNLGPYRERLSRIFQSIKAAYELLSDDARRSAYLDSGK